MRSLKKILLSVIFLFGSSALADKGTPTPPDDSSSVLSAQTIFAEGEALVYEVSWTFFKLGTIHIKTMGNYKAIAYIDSYDGVPFVDLHSVHYTEMDSTLHTLAGYSLDKDGNDWQGLRYIPNLSTMKVAVEQLYSKNPASPPYKQEPKDTIQLRSRRFVDGLAIGYFPRLLIHSVQTVNVQTLLKGNLGVTTFYFTDKKTTESIGVLDDPVRVIEVAGTTNAVGVYGMTGDFTGWFSDDDDAVPIKGKLKVLLGSVTVELIKWNRKGWNPPL